MRARKGLLTVVAVVAATVTCALPAAADDRPTGFIGPDDQPVVGIVGSRPSGPGGGGGGEDDCWWEVSVADDQVQAVYDVDGTQEFSATGRWIQKLCRNGEQVDEQPEGGLVDIDALAREAWASVGIQGPEIRTSPGGGRPLYAQLPTWLWIDRGWWHPYSATARLGRVTATVTATPKSLSWSTGDGATVPCPGPGVPWSAGLPDAASTCLHVYRRATGTGGARLAATVEFSASWTSSIGANGLLPDLRRTGAVSVQVGEIQAIETE